MASAPKLNAPNSPSGSSIISLEEGFGTLPPNTVAIPIRRKNLRKDSRKNNMRKASRKNNMRKASRKNNMRKASRRN